MKNRSLKYGLMRFVRRIWRDEDGSSSLETVIWMPVFALVLAVVMNISMMFFSESQMLRVVQDANRAFSLGRFETTQEAEDYVTARLLYMGAALTVDAQLADGFITTTLVAPAVDLMPMNFMRSAFGGVNVTVSAQQIVEF